MSNLNGYDVKKYERAVHMQFTPSRGDDQFIYSSTPLRSKLKTLDELRRIRERAQANTRMRTTGESDDRIVVSVGMATCGIAAGARQTMTALADAVGKNNLDNVSVVATGCLGYCYAEPMVVVNIPGSEPIRYANVDAGVAEQIIERHVMNGEIVDGAVFGREVPRD